MATVGKVQDIRGESYFEWKIEDFFSLPAKDENRCCSPSFAFAGESWYLRIHPNGQKENKSIGYIDVYLFRKKSGPPITLTWRWGLKTFEGKKYTETQITHLFEKASGCGKPKLLSRSLLSNNKSKLVQHDTVTLFCMVEYYCKSIYKAGKVMAAKCSHCKQDLDAKWLSTREQKCLNKPIRCPTCKKVVALKKWFDQEWEMARVKATEKLVDDLRDILVKEEHSDVTIRVKDEEFRLHRSILASRNPFFNAMFSIDMKEKTTGIVSIDDCEPDVFRFFVHFLYTGEASTLSSDIVCALYEVADKYQEDQLKAECIHFMKNEMSVDSFCDFFVFATRYDQIELLQSATDLFCKKIKEIISSVKWQDFMQEYPTQANELHIKALDYYVK